MTTSVETGFGAQPATCKRTCFYRENLSSTALVSSYSVLDGAAGIPGADTKSIEVVDKPLGQWIRALE
jgi:hypothetical protein